jgi:hypothetical protein
MKPRIPVPRNNEKAQLLVDAAVKRMKALMDQGHFQESLNICLQLTRAHPQMSGAWSAAAANCIHLARWQDAIHYAQTALTRGGNNLNIYDALANAYDQLGQKDKARSYGLQALNMRAARFGGAPPLPAPESEPLPPPPSAQTREHNIISFSLFGGNSKYCEPAILNVQEQPRVYPHWVCRFYVDDSVPESVISRLRAEGAQVVTVSDPAASWPGPMWRFLALDDPQLHRVLFRDADSVISPREAEAVDEWVHSDKRFHIIRDDGSHTELMLAGLWGAVTNSLPSLDKLMDRFLSAPLESQHFADQYFLRKYVWPYARTSLLQHDSIFGFMNAVPFPNERAPNESNVGDREGLPFFTAKSDLPDGSAVTWELTLIETPADGGAAREQRVCAYPATVKNGAVVANIPARYARRLQQGTARVQVTAAPPAADLLE